MRRRKAHLRRRVNGNIRLAFNESALTSYAGLELLDRYLRITGLNARIRQQLDRLRLRSDYGSVALVRLLIGLLIAGGRRLHHVAFLRGDPIFQRFCGLAVLPGDRTLSRWLKGFRAMTVEALRRLNAEVIAQVLRAHLCVRTLTVDVDGTVLSTGAKVAWAFRGYNPHHRKVPSYFPISAYLSETGHILRLQNRPGNVNDGKASLRLLRETFGQLQETLGSGYRLRFRMDGDFFKRTVVRLLEAKGAGYAIKVPFYQWLDLQSVIRKRRRWKRIEAGVEGFPVELRLPPWNRSVRVGVFRKRVYHRTRKNYQLDLFDPSNGTYEYSAIATNLTLDLRRLWRFMCGRGMHEKVIGELKSGLALATIPTNHYGANSAWQQLVVLAHNLLVNFQIETGTARRACTQKRTALWVLKRAATLRFELISRAGRLVRPHGTAVLRLLRSERAKADFLRIGQALARMA